MEVAHERSPGEHRARVGPRADEVEQAHGDLVVDALGQRRLELRINADIGDDQTFKRRRLEVLWQAGGVLDGESLQRGTTLEDVAHTAGEIVLDVRLGGEAAQLDEFHAPDAASS